MAAPGTPGKSYSLPGFTASYGAPFMPGPFALGGAGRVFWVGNGTLGNGTFPSGNGSNPDYPLSTIEAAFSKTVTGRGDIIYVMAGLPVFYYPTAPGAAENAQKMATEIIKVGIDDPTWPLYSATNVANWVNYP